MKTKKQREKELFHYINEKAGVTKDGKLTVSGVSFISAVMADFYMQAVSYIVKKIDEEE